MHDPKKIQHCCVGHFILWTYTVCDFFERKILLENQHYFVGGMVGDLRKKMRGGGEVDHTS